MATDDAVRDAALRALHDEHARVLWAVALRLSGNDAARAEDLVQETMLRAWRHLDDMPAAVPAQRSWLLTTARRLAIDDWRTPRRRLELVADELPEGRLEDETDALVQSSLVVEALRRLTPDHRAVIVHCYYLGRTTPQAAAVLGIPEGTVKSRLHYGLKALRLALAELGVTS